MVPAHPASVRHSAAVTGRRILCPPEVVLGSRTSLICPNALVESVVAFDLRARSRRLRIQCVGRGTAVRCYPHMPPAGVDGEDCAIGEPQNRRNLVHGRSVRRHRADGYWMSGLGRMAGSVGRARRRYRGVPGWRPPRVAHHEGERCEQRTSARVPAGGGGGGHGPQQVNNGVSTPVRTRARA